MPCQFPTTHLPNAASCVCPRPPAPHHPAAAGRRWGAFFGGDGTLLAAQIVALIVVICWVSLFFLPYFWVLRRLGVIRVPVEQELAGLDASKYNLMTTNELPVLQKPRQKVHV